MRLTALVALTLSIAFGWAGLATARSGYATIDAFAPDLLHGDNGLPPSSDFPLVHGPIAAPTTVDGDAIDAHEGQSVAYFDGNYYLYGVEYGCGTHGDIVDYAPFCGFSTYRSHDLEHWRLVDDFDTPQMQTICAAYCAFPKVIYSPNIHRYLLFFSSDNGGNFGSTQPSSRWLAESRSPSGPWTNLRKPNLVHGDVDPFDIHIDRDGTAYMVEDRDKVGEPTDVWVEKLNADYTGTTGEVATAVTGPFGRPAFFQRGRHWYMAFLVNAKYFGPADIVYLRADHPMGPYTNVDDRMSTAATTISAKSCGGTAQGFSVLPSPDGPVPVALIDLYVSSPNSSSPSLPDRVKHGDWNQAIAGRYWAPLSFDAEGRIKPIECRSSTRIQLAHASPASVDRRPVQQPDCRVTATGALRQSWTVPARSGLRAIRVPVFQRVYMTSPVFLPPVQPPTAVDAPLTVRLSSAGHEETWTIDPRDVSWAARSVTLRLKRPVHGGSRVTLALETRTSNGCYGVLVGASHPETGVEHASYQALENGQPKPAAGVQMELFPG